MSRTEELVVLIRKHRQLYYNDTPEVEDDVFDAWVDELTELDPSNPVLQEVGADVDESHWEIVEHTIPMTSLDKVNTAEELQVWMAQRPASAYCVQEKLDGISVSCFAGDTMITLANGEQEEIKNLVDTGKTVSVASYSPDTGECHSYATRFFKNGKKKCIKITFENGESITCTPDHLFFVEGEGWVQAQYLAGKDIKELT